MSRSLAASTGRLPADFRLPRAAPALLLALAALATYAGTLANGFVFDDALQVLENPWIRDARHLREIFANQVWAFAGRDSNYYRPLMHVVYAGLYNAFGPAPVVFHGLSLLLHAVTTLLVFGIIDRLLRDPADGGAPGFHLAAFLGSLLFAVHPVHVEAVAWVSGLPDLACGTFSVAAILAFLTSWRSTVRAASLHLLGAAFFLAAVLFKEPGLTLPAVVAALDLAQRPRGLGGWFWATRYGALGTAGAVYVALRFHALGGIVPHASESHFGLVEAVQLAGVAMWRYLAMLFVPWPLNAFQTLASAPGLPPWIALVGFPLAAIVSLRRAHLAWTAALALWLLPLLPALYAPALLPGLDNPWAERYLYLPSVGFAVAVAIACTAGPAVARRLVVGATILATVLCCVLTIARIPVWRDDLSLWTDATAKSPDAGAAHGALGHARFVRGDVDGAIREYEQAIRLKPNHADTQLNLGVARAILGQHDAALAPYRTALTLRPRHALTHANVAISLSMLARHGEALAAARRAVELEPELARGHHALGVALGNAGNLAEATAAFRRAVQLDPTDRQSRANLERAQSMLPAPAR